MGAMSGLSDGQGSKGMLFACNNVELISKTVFISLFSYAVHGCPLHTTLSVQAGQDGANVGASGMKACCSETTPNCATRHLSS